MEVVQINCSSLNQLQEILMWNAVYWVVVLPAVLQLHYDRKFLRISSHLLDRTVLIIDAFDVFLERMYKVLAESGKPKFFESRHCFTMLMTKRQLFTRFWVVAGHLIGFPSSDVFRYWGLFCQHEVEAILFEWMQFHAKGVLFFEAEAFLLGRFVHELRY